MKKLGKVLSLVMALALTVCSLSATAFAKELKSYVTQPTDGYYHYNIDSTASEDDAEDIGADIYQKDNTRDRFYVFYKTEDGKLVNCDIDKGQNRAGHDDSCLENFWHQVLKRDHVVIGTVIKVEPITGYRFDKVTDVAQLANIADDVTESNLENVLASFYDTASSILCDKDYAGENVAFFYMAEEKDIEGTLETIYSGADFHSGNTINMNAGAIQDIIDENGYVYVLVPETEPTTDAPTTTAAATTTTAATSPQTGDTSMTASFIALGVVAVCGLAVVTFATKKDKNWL